MGSCAGMYDLVGFRLSSRFDKCVLICSGLLMDKIRKNYIIARYARGSTLQEIGDLFGITRERVRQIIRNSGFKGVGGLAVQTQRNLEERARARDQKYLCSKGCSWNEYIVLRAMKGPTIAFSQQRNNAAIRGIRWELNLWQWWSVWKQSGHWEDRGRKSGQYVMCRKGDKGAYKTGNVYISTCNDNCKEFNDLRRGSQDLFHG